MFQIIKYEWPFKTSGITYLQKRSQVQLLELPGPHHLHMSNPEEVGAAVTSFLGLDDKPSGNGKAPFEFKGL